jgi:hypothetical protein
MWGKSQSFPDPDSYEEEMECENSWSLTNCVSSGVTVFVKDEWRRLQSVNLRARRLSGAVGLFLKVFIPPAWIRIVGPSTRYCL